MLVGSARRTRSVTSRTLVALHSATRATDGFSSAVSALDLIHDYPDDSTTGWLTADYKAHDYQ